MVRPVVVAVCLVMVMALFPGASVHAGGSLGDDQADIVWGQPDFLHNGCNGGPNTPGTPPPASASGLCAPLDVAVDAQGNVWVADWSRVLMYAPGQTTASKVLGQQNFTDDSCNTGMPTGEAGPSSICYPDAVTLDSHGTLFVSDSDNNRILVFFNAASKPSGAAADLVLGQPNFTTKGENDDYSASSTVCPVPPTNTSGSGHPYTNACSLNQPHFLSVDAAGDLLVADTNNNRVLLWPASDFNPASHVDCSTHCELPATMGWGQYGSMTVTDPNAAPQAGYSGPCPATSNVAPTACTLFYPYQAIADAQGHLYIADEGNRRVLEYDGALSTDLGRQVATMVFGQDGNFNTEASGVSATLLNSPASLALDPAGNLWVSDMNNSRVLEFPDPTGMAGSTTAIAALGQHRNLQTSVSSTGSGMGASVLNLVAGIAFDSVGNAYVADMADNRVLEYYQPYPVSARIGLAAGWNLLALPSTTALPYSASTVISQVDQEGGNVSEVAAYANGRYQVYVPGYASDFPVNPKQGFWVLATTSSMWTTT